MRHVVWGSLFLIGSVAVVASAQDTGRSLAPIFLGGGYGLRGGHASTAREGAARGMADVIRSRGAANMMNSEAAKNYEDARKKYIDNRLHGTQTYFEMRKVNRDARAAEKAERRPPPTQEQLIRIAKSQLPDRPSASQVDPLTGGIKWPVALRSEAFASDRAQMEKLYGERAADGYFSPDAYLKVKTLSTNMISELRKNISRYPGNLSIEARKFLEGLAYEAQFQAG